MSTSQTGQQHYSFDQVIEISISNDELTATMTYFPTEEENKFDKHTLLTYIKDKGIRYGLKDELIDKFLAAPSQFVNKEIRIAEGKPPVDGEDAYLEMLCYQQTDKKPKVNEDGSVDFYSITQIANVVTGQIIAKKIPFTEGTDGLTVTQTEIPAKAGKDLKLKAGKNVVIDHQNQALYAATDGQVSVTNVINVFPVFEVNGDLDLSIGHIDFVGNVVIRGNVPSGFKIKAKGDIRIIGGVEGAEVISESSIHISSGITAQHKGIVKAGKDIHTGFIVNGIVQADGNVHVSQSIMHSHVMAGDLVECSGDKGLIVGGHIQAGNGVQCRTIGNSMTTQTTIEVGSQPNTINRKNELDQYLQQIKETIAKTDQALSVLDQMALKLGALPPDKKELQIKLTNTKLESEKKMKDLVFEIKELEEEMLTEQPCKIEVSGMLYAGTKLILGKYMKYIKENQKRVLYVLENKEIVAKPLM